MKKKLISVILVVTMLFSFAGIPAGAVTSERVNSIYENGYTMPAIVFVSKCYNTYYKVMRAVTGNDDYEADKYNLSVDDMFSGIIESIFEESGVDLSLIYNNFPETNGSAEKFTKLFNIDIPKLQEKLMERKNELEADGKLIAGGLVRILSAWVGIVDKCDLVMEQVDDSNNYEVMLYITYRDGREDKIHSPVYYSAETQLFSGSEGTPIFLGFYFDASTASAFTGSDVWQRNFGYGLFYDLFCYSHPFWFTFNTQRIKFNYDSKQWMIQLWKGRYFITNGAEVGVYTRPERSIGTWYNCASDDEMLYASATLSHGDDVIFDVPQREVWWLSNFKLSDTAYIPQSLTLTSTITMKDADMLSSFTGAIDKNPQITYMVNGLDVTVTW